MLSVLSVTYTMFFLVFLFVLGKPRKQAQDWAFIGFLAALALGLLAPFVVAHPVVFACLDSVIVIAAPLLLFYTDAVLGHSVSARRYWQLGVFFPVLAVGFVFPQNAAELALFKVAYVVAYLTMAMRTYFGRAEAAALSSRTYWFYLLFGGLVLLSCSGAASVLQAFVAPGSLWLVSEAVAIPVATVLLLALTYVGVRFHGPFQYFAEDGQYRLRTPPASGQERAVLRSVFETFDASMRGGKLYLEPTFGLSDAAQLLGLNSQVLSQAINEHSRGGFSEWMARARTKEFQLLLDDAGHAQHSLLDLGLMAGFGSKSSFNRVIREQTGLSPRQLRLQLTRNP